MQTSQYKNWKSPGNCRNLLLIIVGVYYRVANNAIVFNTVRLVAIPALHYLIKSTTHDISYFFEVKCEDNVLYAYENNIPTSACFNDL